MPGTSKGLTPAEIRDIERIVFKALNRGEPSTAVNQDLSEAFTSAYRTEAHIAGWTAEPQTAKSQTEHMRDLFKSTPEDGPEGSAEVSAEDPHVGGNSPGGPILTPHPQDDPHAMPRCPRCGHADRRGADDEPRMGFRPVAGNAGYYECAHPYHDDNETFPDYAECLIAWRTPEGVWRVQSPGETAITTTDNDGYAGEVILQGYTDLGGTIEYVTIDDAPEGTSIERGQRDAALSALNLLLASSPPVNPQFESYQQVLANVRETARAIERDMHARHEATGHDAGFVARTIVGFEDIGRDHAALWANFQTAVRLLRQLTRGRGIGPLREAQQRAEEFLEPLDTLPTPIPEEETDG